jgi:hypothetical protein
MKVKATDVVGSKNITLNKEYEVITEKGDNLLIKNDLNREGLYKKIRFTVVENAPTVFKVGDKFEDDSGNKFIIAKKDSLIALASLADGEIITDFMPVADLHAITHDDMARLDDEWESSPLRKI